MHEPRPSRSSREVREFESHEYSEGAYFSHRLPFNPGRARLWSVLCQFLTRYISPEHVVLDLGGGYCDFINNIRAKEKHVLDLFEGIRKFAASGVIAHVASCTDLSEFPTGSFDIVFASNLFEHLTRHDLEATVGEVHRILRLGGKLIIIQPNFKYSYREYFDDYTHRLIFTETSLSEYLSARRFQVSEVIARFLPYSMKNRYPKPSWLLRLYLASPFRPKAGQMLIVAERNEAVPQAD